MYMWVLRLRGNPRYMYIQVDYEVHIVGQKEGQGSPSKPQTTGRTTTTRYKCKHVLRTCTCIPYPYLIVSNAIY